MNVAALLLAVLDFLDGLSPAAWGVLFALVMVGLFLVNRAAEASPAELAAEDERRAQAEELGWL